MYPLKFCAHRWVENVTVAQRAIDVLPAMKVYVDTLIKEKRQPKNNKLFSTVKEAVNDVLFYAKLHFFSFCGQAVSGVSESVPNGSPNGTFS